MNGVSDIAEQVARRFPLVPRFRPTLPPLAQQLVDIADLARTPADHPDAVVRIAALTTTPRSSQIAVLAHTLSGTHAAAVTPLADTVPSPSLAGRRRPGPRPCDSSPRMYPGVSRRRHAADLHPAEGGATAAGVFGIEIHSAAVELVDDSVRPPLLAELTRAAGVAFDANIAHLDGILILHATPQIVTESVRSMPTGMMEHAHGAGRSRWSAEPPRG